MLRDKNLIPLSHQHQHALALCVRISRSSPIAESDLDAWHREIVQLFQGEIDAHFAAEEQIVFPAALQFDELVMLIQELMSDHTELRGLFGQGGTLSSYMIGTLARLLSEHIRKEERQLFERLQQLMTPEELTLLGSLLEAALKDAQQACLIPTDATRLRPAQ
jgi:iron-sulfur cluster repair protein YtfE (RIC family)